MRIWSDDEGSINACIPEKQHLKCLKSFSPFIVRYEVVEKSEAAKDALEQLVSFIKNTYRGKTGIVYAFSRKEASDVASGLAARGVPAAFYHAGQEASVVCVCVCKYRRAWLFLHCFLDALFICGLQLTLP